MAMSNLKKVFLLGCHNELDMPGRELQSPPNNIHTKFSRNISKNIPTLAGEYICGQDHVSFLLGFVGLENIPDVQSVDEIKVDIIKSVQNVAFVLVTFFYKDYLRITSELESIGFEKINSKVVQFIADISVSNNF